MTGQSGRTLVVTYCSRDKNPAVGLLPAVDRYLSPRIHATAEAAAILGHDFRILSGLYGLLAPDQPIPLYDYLLTADQVNGHEQKVAKDLKELGPSQVVLITRPVAEDPGCEAYGEVMRRACGRLGVGFVRREISEGDPSAADLAKLI